MKNFLLKTWLTMICLLFGVGTMWATDVTFNPASDKSFPKDGITLSVTDGTLTNGTDYRVYKNKTMTISSTVGNITNIALTYSSASYDGGGWAASYQPNATSWTSPTANGEQARITKIVVTVSSGGSTPTKYGITVDVSNLGDTGNGFSVNGTYYSSYQYLANAAAAGETVTLTASPNTGYKATADCWNVLQGTTPVSVTGNGNNYSFTMPAGNVSISPEFVAESTPSTPTKLGTPSNLSATNVTATSADLSWDAVTNASSYKLTVYDDELNSLLDAETVNAATYSLSGLTAETHYNWYVQAIGDGINYSNSECSNDGEFTTEAEQGGGDEPSGEGTTVTFDNLGYASWGKSASFSGSTYDELSQTKSDVVFDYTRGSGSTYANTTSIRFYKDNQLKFTAPNGYHITSIVWTGSSFKDDVTTDAETCTSTTSALSWSGNASSVTFTRPSSATSYATLSSVSVTIVANGGDTPEPEKTTPTLSFASATATAYLDALSLFVAPALATDPENLSGVTYSMTGDDVGTINASTGELALTAAGTATITASYAGDGVNYDAAEDASYTLTVNANAPENTIAEFIASKGGCCYLTGTVSNITNTTYGNFNLTDETGTIFIYGCLTSEGEEKQFASLGVVAGDKIKVLANEYDVYNKSAEAKNVIFVKEIEIEKTKYTVTIETPENGTLVVKDGETTLASGDQVEEGNTITIQCTPTDAENYRYKNWQYKEDGDWVTVKTTMTRVVTKNIAIRATFEEIPTYAIKWSVNGTVLKTENLKEGATLTAPKVSAINGKSFTGWVTTPTVDADATPEYVIPATATDNVTYYAVFASAGGSGGTATATLSIEEYADANSWKSQTQYKNATFNDITATVDYTSMNNSINTGKYYEKNNTVTEDTWRIYQNEGASITLASSNGNIKSVIVNYFIKESGSGENKKYPTFLYNESEVESGAKTTMDNASATFTVGGDGGNIQIYSIVVEYANGSASYSNFTTLPDGYCREGLTPNTLGTICIPYAVSEEQVAAVAETVAFYEISHKVVDGETVKKVMFTPATELVAGMPYIFYTGAESFTLHYNGEADAAGNKNGLYGALEKFMFAETYKAGKYYVISNSKIQAASSQSGVNANRAYIVMSEVPTEPTTSNSGRLLSIGANGFEFEDGVITGVEALATDNCNEIYDLQGRRVVNAKNGMYIVNGKKVIF